MAELSPNRRYDHVYAIVRVDRFDHAAARPEAAITITRVVWSRDTADAEVSRLNRLNRDKGATYFWKITRLERRPDPYAPADETLRNRE